MVNLAGLGVALVTPFTKAMEVDYDALKRILDHLYSSAAVDYLVVMGSTGEASTLSFEEKQAIMNFVNTYNQGKLPLVFGHSGNNTAELINTLSKLRYEGYSAILSASPAYIKPAQQGIIAHYTALADASKLPIIIYNVPSRTGSNISAESTARLALHPNILGIKEASGNLEQAIEIKAKVSDDFLLISGDDLLTIPLCSIGAVGLISVLANAYPQIFKEIISFCAKGNYKSATNTLFKLLKINRLMYDEGNPAGIKQLLAHQGLCEPYLRLPLVQVSNNLSKAIKENLIN